MWTVAGGVAVGPGWTTHLRRYRKISISEKHHPYRIMLVRYPSVLHVQGGPVDQILRVYGTRTVVLVQFVYRYRMYGTQIFARRAYGTVVEYRIILLPNRRATTTHEVEWRHGGLNCTGPYVVVTLFRKRVELYRKLWSKLQVWTDIWTVRYEYNTSTRTVWAGQGLVQEHQIGHADVM